MTIIDVNRLTKRYGSHTAVDGVSLSVSEGEIFGVLGPNGAGKTTLVETLEGLRRPDSGAVRVLGIDPTDRGDLLRQQIGVQLQQTHLPDTIKVWEALDLYASFYRRPRDWRALIDEWGLADKRNTRFGKLSGGQQQRLFITLALVGNPRIAFLDELTSGLDPQARRATWQVISQIRDTGVTVVLVSHFMDEVEALCDRAAVMDHGRIVAVDSPAGLIAGAGFAEDVRFRIVDPFDLDVLDGLPGVERVVRSGEQVIVTGSGDVAVTVTGALARAGAAVADLRIDRRTLDDAFAALTGDAATNHSEESHE